MKRSNISKLSKLGISSGMRYERGDLVTISGDDTIWKIDEAIPNSDFRLIRLSWLELIWYKFKKWWYERKLNKLQKKMNKKNQPGIGDKPFKLKLEYWSIPRIDSLFGFLNLSTGKLTDVTITSSRKHEIGDLIQMPFKESDKKVNIMKVTKVKTPNLYMLGELTRWDKFKLWIKRLWL